MTSARRSSAQRSTADRASGDSTAPVGHWCAGVRITASASMPRSTVDVDAVRSDRHPDHVEPGRYGDLPRVLDRRGVLHDDPAGARLGEHLEEQGDALGETVADHHVGGLRRRTPRPVEVVGERGVQLVRPAAGQRAEPVARRVEQHPADRAEPGRPREVGGVTAAVPEVDDRRRRGKRGRGSRVRLRTDGDLGVAAAAGWSDSPRRPAARRPRRRRRARPRGRRPTREWRAAAVPSRSRPDRTPSRIDDSIWRCSGTRRSRRISTSRSAATGIGPEFGHRIGS